MAPADRQGRSPRRGRLRRRLAGLLVVLALVLLPTLGPTAYVQARALGHTYDATSVPPAGVALVLGASVEPSGEPSAFLAARLDIAVQLYEAGTVQRVLVSGDGRTSDYDEPAAMRSYLMERGVAEADITTDPAGLDTFDSCVRAQQEYGVTSLIVVTQSYHLPRAVAACRSIGLAADGVGDDSVRRFSEVWDNGVLREYPANIKLAIDLIRRAANGSN
ncbi:SanA/YdcF family protein [Propionibacteriaceae bacterium Y2011]|uniref:SanA/YdcF family protein n=1 Tax=Microlunatus sp. Y2014 TaxID=3418488 RepID=UPI003B462343